MEQPQPVDRQQTRWEWQSNPNPWTSQEPSTWTPYESSLSELLEKAYCNQEKQVDLGDYVVHIKGNGMLQIEKNSVFKQRRVRRVGLSSDLVEETKTLEENKDARKMRFFGAENPKTINRAFGDLKHFLNFFQNRNPEIKVFSETIQQIEASQDFDKLTNVVLPVLAESLVTECFKEANTEDDQNKLEGLLVSFYQKPYTSWRQFYGDILTAYTMDTFLYRNLNRYLRDENWIELDCLLPYAVCLCRAFNCTEISSSSEISSCKLTGDAGSNNLILYRGARFDEASLSFYNCETTPNFSWNSVTSTSADQKIAEKFTQDKWNDKKTAVLFKIEVPRRQENLQNSSLLDIKEYSDFIEEKEIVLPPGSIFELKKCSASQTGVEIHLKLVDNVISIQHQGQIMYGAMQADNVTGVLSKITCVKDRELMDAIRHKKGNRLIEELELAYCRFDTDALESLNDTLLKMPRLSKLVLLHLSSKENTHLKAIVDTLREKEMKTLEITERGSKDEQLIPFAQGIGHLSSLTSLTLNFERCIQITNTGLHSLSSEGLSGLSSLTTLALNFERCNQITDAGLYNLSSSGLTRLPLLTALTLGFEFCKQITDTALHSLSSVGLSSLPSLTVLSLNFGWCKKITDTGLHSLSSVGLNSLPLLTALSLNFEGCYEITDTGLHSLSSGLSSLSSLTALTLNFEWCKQITDTGLHSLSSAGISSLSLLTALNLNFGGCYEITDTGLHSLSSVGISSLSLMTALTLNFGECDEITDTGLHSLISSGLSGLSLLNNLTLHFNPQLTKALIEFQKKTKVVKPCLVMSFSSSEGNETQTYSYTRNSRSDWIEQKDVELENKDVHYSVYTDENLNGLCSSDFSSSSSPIAVNLDFKDRNKIKDSELHSLSPVDLGKLSLQTSLALKFVDCRHITDTGLDSLCSSGLGSWSSLTCLTLNFGRCDKITDTGLYSLSFAGLSSLSSLIALTLDFERCNQITDTGLYDLSSVGLSSLSSLTSLNLNFGGCYEITDTGLQILSSAGLSSRSSLTSLTLNFGGCYQITDAGLQSLGSVGFSSLSSLNALTLDFGKCDEITDTGLHNLSSTGLSSLSSLIALTLRFELCDKITDKGLYSFVSEGISHLESLASLAWDFNRSHNIPCVAFKDINSLLKYFGYEVTD